MTKIGTFNFHRAHNFGAVLVAYSMIEKLKSLGCDAYCVDYWPEYHAVRYTRSHPKIQEFIDRLPKKRVDDSAEEYDLLVYGSDCIWHVYDFSGLGTPDPYYLGKNPIKAKKSIAYSASTATNTFNEESYKLFAEYLPLLDTISAREKCFAEYLQQFTDKKVIHTCDPVLLLARDYWKSFASKRLTSRNYALFYNQQFNTNIVQRIAETIRNKTGLPVLIISSDFTLRNDRLDIVMDDIGPHEFLSAFMNADFVLSSSFHGVMFSIVFEKQFYSLSYMVGASRTADFLRTVNLSEREISHSKDIDISAKIDYSFVSNKLSQFIIESEDYLKRNIIACGEDAL